MAEAKNNQTPDVSEQDKIRRGKLADLQAAGNDPFLITKYNVTHHSMEIKNNFDELEGQEVTVAGRMMQKRVMGKASFCNVQDLKGSIQIYVARDNIGDARVAHGVIGQFNGQVTQDARVDARLLVGMHHAHTLGLKHPVGRVLVAGNQRRPVVARVLTNQNRCARHAHPP